MLAPSSNGNLIYPITPNNLSLFCILKQKSKKIRMNFCYVNVAFLRTLNTLGWECFNHTEQKFYFAPFASSLIEIATKHMNIHVVCEAIGVALIWSNWESGWLKIEPWLFYISLEKVYKSKRLPAWELLPTNSWKDIFCSPRKGETGMYKCCVWIFISLALQSRNFYNHPA